MQTSTNLVWLTSLILIFGLACTEEQPGQTDDNSGQSAEGSNSASGAGGVTATGVMMNTPQSGATPNGPMTGPTPSTAGQVAAQPGVGGTNTVGGQVSMPSMAGGPNIISPVGGRDGMGPGGGRANMRPMGGRPDMRPNDQCGRQNRCPAGEVCAPGPNGRSCQPDCRDDDAMCPMGETCSERSGICMPGMDGGPCDGDADCDAGQLCVVGQCRDLPPCLNGRCVAGGAFECDEATMQCVQRPCMDDDDCPGRSTCSPETMRCARSVQGNNMNPQTRCRNDGDCENEQVCRRGRCADPRDNMGPMGGRMPPFPPVGGIMPPLGGANGGNRCRRPDDCPGDQLCIDRVCVPRAGAGDPCLNDRECGAGFICDEMTRTCSAGCQSDRDCNDDQICDEQTNSCQPAR